MIKKVGTNMKFRKYEYHIIVRPKVFLPETMDPWSDEAISYAMRAASNDIDSSWLGPSDVVVLSVSDQSRPGVE